MKWIARYNDGESLNQYNPDGSENRYADIDRERLSGFSVLGDLNEHLITLHLDPGQRLIYRRRVRQSCGGPPVVVYLVGWQMTVSGKNIQSIAYISEGNEIHMAGAWKEDHPWFYPIQNLPFEVQD